MVVNTFSHIIRNLEGKKKSTETKNMYNFYESGNVMMMRTSERRMSRIKFYKLGYNVTLDQFFR